MGEYVSAIVAGLGGSIAAVVGAIALLVKARATASRPRTLLERTMDWLETTGLISELPPTLAADIERELAGSDDDQSG